LSKVPDDRTEITDAESVKALLVSAYPEAQYFMMGETMSDNADDKGSALTPQAAESAEECYFWRNVSVEYQDSPGFYWAHCYSAIAAANHALEAIEAMGDTPDLQPYRGEALLCRAYAHFMLVNFWGEHFDPVTSATELGVPYVTAPEKTDIAYYQRVTVKEVYDLIEKDLKEGLPLIRDDVYDVAKYHFNREAANAFAARYYTYRGDNWDLVKQYSNAVLGEEGTNFKNYLRDYPGKYRALSSNPTEFAKLYTNYGEASNLMLTIGNSYWGVTAGFSRYGMSQRVQKWVIDSLDIGNTSWMNNLIWGTYPHYMIYKFTVFFQYLYPGSSLGYYTAVNPAFTAEEVMFNRMEAYVMDRQYDKIINDFHIFWNVRANNYTSDLDFDKIKEYYNTLLKGKWERPDPWYRDQLDDEQLLMLKYITDVRRKEFMHQGMRWFDVKRFHIPVTHAVYASNQVDVLTKDDLRRVVQIPPSAVDYGVTPNPR
jgi:hypothetical protein